MHVFAAAPCSSVLEWACIPSSPLQLSAGMGMHLQQQATRWNHATVADRVLTKCGRDAPRLAKVACISMYN